MKIKYVTRQETTTTESQAFILRQTHTECDAVKLTGVFLLKWNREVSAFT